MAFEGVHIDDLSGEATLISSSGQSAADAHTCEKLQYIDAQGEKHYLITVDDVVVSETQNRQQSHKLYGKALDQMDSL